MESNKPVPYEHSQPLPRPSPLKQPQHIVNIPQKPNEQRVGSAPEQIYAPQHLPPQAIKYAVPANVHYTPQQKPTNQNHRPRFESPANRYQLIAFPQQYPGGQLPGPFRPENQDPNSQVQYYFPKEKEILASHFEDSQHQLLYETQGVMKIVEPPQLQYQQPSEQQKHSQQNSHSKYAQQKKIQAQSTQPIPTQESQPQRPQSQPSRSQIYVSRTTQGPPIPQNEKQKLPPLKIDPNRPLTQEEFQALVDQGYNIVPVPVPVPYPVHVP